MKIVVVDDSPEIVEVVSICLQLRWSDAILLSASNGWKGVELVKTHTPDAVILDVNLPDIDGFQVLQEIRRFSRVPVVMLTVKGKDVDIARGLALGADDYVVKPFSNIELIARVETAMRHIHTTTPKTNEGQTSDKEILMIDSTADIKPEDKK
ncbi:MAG: response regulator transcription factor [Dehalococcoidales bacterium]|nr:response regulator transcription factor [Dehalococcoidales bacterium]